MTPKKLFKIIIKRNRYCLYSEYQNQKNDSYCASYCLYILYLAQVVSIDFKSAVSNLYCQRFSFLNGFEQIAIDNSVRYIPISEKTNETDKKPKKIKAGSPPGKQNKKISQNNKKFL